MRQLPSIPNAYVCATVDRAKDVVGEAIAKCLREKPLTAPEINRRYPGIRAGDIQKMLAGDHRLYGLNRLFAFAEALGVEVKVTA